MRGSRRKGITEKMGGSWDSLDLSGSVPWDKVANWNRGRMNHGRGEDELGFVGRGRFGRGSGWSWISEALGGTHGCWDELEGSDP